MEYFASEFARERWVERIPMMSVGDHDGSKGTRRWLSGDLDLPLVAVISDLLDLSAKLNTVAEGKPIGVAAEIVVGLAAARIGRVIVGHREIDEFRLSLGRDQVDRLVDA